VRGQKGALESKERDRHDRGAQGETEMEQSRRNLHNSETATIPGLTGLLPAARRPIRNQSQPLCHLWSTIILIALLGIVLQLCLGLNTGAQNTGI
jgi:hypothetical protein